LGYANLWISTFHSFADRVLRDEALQLGITTNYRLLTEAENVQFLRQNLFKLNLNYFRPLGNPNKFVVGMLNHFSRLKDEDVQTKEYDRWVQAQGAKRGDKEVSRAGKCLRKIRRVEDSGRGDGFW